MEDLYFNLSEEEFSRGRKILLWVFAGLFFLAGVIVLMQSLVFDKKSIHPILSIAPFGISFIVSLIALMASIQRKDLFFKINDDLIEFRFGLFKPKRKSFKWDSITEIILPQKQKKAKIHFKDGSSFIIDITWLQRKKSSLIRKHMFYVAKQKSINVIRVDHLK